MKWSHRTPVDQMLVVLVVILTLVGILAVFSASWPHSSRPSEDGIPGDPYEFLVSQTRFAVVGGLACIAFAFVAPLHLKRLALVGYVVSLVFLVLCLLIGVEMGGARSWLKIGPIQFQPSEVAKLMLILMLARVVGTPRKWPKVWPEEREERWPKEQVMTYAWCIGLTLPVAGLCVAQPDLGTAVLAFCFGLVAIFFAGIRHTWIALTTTGAFTAALFLAWIEPYRWERITAFLHPFRDTADTGYQISRMLITIARGGLLGQGFGLSKVKWISLPARHTDSIYCIIAGELGLVGAAVLVAVFFLLARRALILARTQPDTFSAVAMATLVLEGECRAVPGRPRWQADID